MLPERPIVLHFLPFHRNGIPLNFAFPSFALLSSDLGTEKIFHKAGIFLLLLSTPIRKFSLSLRQSRTLVCPSPRNKISKIRAISTPSSVRLRLYFMEFREAFGFDEETFKMELFLDAFSLSPSRFSALVLRYFKNCLHPLMYVYEKLTI